ncbi:MAG: AMIN domain-containing protein [Vicinamibacterales bacterium]
MTRRAIAGIALVLSLGVAVDANAGGGRGRLAGAAALTSVVVMPDGNFVQVSLRGNGPLPAVTPARTTEGAPRLFVDLPGVVMGDLPARINGAGPVARIRVAQNSIDPPVTRVVFDLTGDVTFGVAPAGPATNDITIAIAPAAPASPLAAVARPPAPAVPAPAPKPVIPTPTVAAVAAPTAPAATSASVPAPAAVRVPPPPPGTATPVPPQIPRAAATVVAPLRPAQVSTPQPAPAARPAATTPVAPVVPQAPTSPRTAAVPTPVAPQPAPASRLSATPPSSAASTRAVPMSSTGKAPVAPASASAPTPAATTPTSNATTSAPASPASPTATTPTATTGTTTASTSGTTMAVQTTPTAPRPIGGFGMGRTAHPQGRVAIYTSGAHASQPSGYTTSYGDIMTAVSYSFLDRTSDGFEYGLDMRHTAYTIEGRQPRVSIYNGFIGARLADGHASVRAGHLWLDDLGGLGALAGAQVEARSSSEVPTSGVGRWRGGLFGGLDPNVYRFGYGDGVRKLGAYGVLEGGRGRRHVAAYINVHNGDLTERSVLSFANFLPVGPFFAYQVAEYDLSPVAGGLGHDGLNYFFTNMRYTVGRRLELQGTVSRGRSVDARGLSDDIQAGRPVSQQAIDGLLYQSYGGRVTAEVLPRVRIYGGYSRDKNNRDDAPTGRWLSGGYATNVFGSGLDLTASDSRISRSSGTYHSMYLSAGRQLGQRIYATTEFSTALSLVRFVRGDGFVVESKPSTKRFGGNASVQTWHATSLYVSVEHTSDNDGYREWRALTGVTFRLR